MQELHSTAYHEAGHAVIAVLEKLTVVRVSIEPCDEMLGHTSYECFRLEDEHLEAYRGTRGAIAGVHVECEAMRLGWEKWRVEANARTVLAGEIAERMFDPDAALSDGALRDRARFRLWLVELALDRAEREVYAELLRMQTERQVRKYWRAVEAVAELLLERTTIDETALVQRMAPICAAL